MVRAFLGFGKKSNDLSQHLVHKSNCHLFTRSLASLT